MSSRPSSSSSSAAAVVVLSKAQLDLLERYGSNLEKGYTTDEASRRREDAPDYGTFNVVDPPIKCPPAVCCLLPCIKHLPKQKLFRRIRPEDAEVKRNGRWIRYDAASLVTGDVIRVEEGDVVPADCVVLALERRHSSSSDDLLVDHRYVTGEDKPRCSRAVTTTNANAVIGGGGSGAVAVSADEDLVAAKPVQLFWGGHVNRGSAVAVVTAIGPNTLIASLIREGKFPPKCDVAVGDGVFNTTTTTAVEVAVAVDDFAQEDGDEEEEGQVGISLLERDAL